MLLLRQEPGAIRQDRRLGGLDTWMAVVRVSRATAAPRTAASARSVVAPTVARAQQQLRESRHVAADAGAAGQGAFASGGG